ncbi:MAG: helix-turn-helix domain-containing protein, partial [Eubacteriales bacterium]
MLYEQSRSGTQHYLYVSRSKDLTFGDHMHSSFEFILVTDGILHASLLGKPYTLRAGQALLILPNRVHHFSSPEGSENLTVIFSPDYVSEFYAAVRSCDFRNPVFEYSDTDRILTLDPENIFHCMGILYGICAAAYDACMPEVSEKRDDLLMSRVADYIRDHFQSDMSLCGMAKDLGYNTCYLSDFINKNFGTHFRTLLNSYRIDYAMTLLRTTDLPITGIADRCGFSTIRSFNRAFCKINGIS